MASTSGEINDHMSQWSYSRCAECQHGHRQVFPSGPLDARVAVIGEGPGWRENVTGRPFDGKAGQELDETYLRLAGLDRSEVFVTNMVQCRQERNGIDVRPAEALLKCCSENHLYEELATVNPEIVVLCGATACSMYPEIDLELEHGFPRKIGERWVVPMYHPAAGLHETRYMTPMLEDWERLGMWMRGKWAVPAREEREPRYEKLWGEIAGLWPKIALDTETDEGRPYCIQWSGVRGTGYLLFADDTRGLGKFRAWMEQDRPVVSMHNAPFDLDVMDQLGIEIKNFRDTQQELYHLGNLPQGLKAAVYRVFGYRMTSYDEVVTPHSKAALETWLAEALAHVSMEMRTEVREQLKTKVRVTMEPHEAEAVLRRVMGRLDSDYDPWEKPKQDKGVEKPRLIGREWLDEVEAAVGRMPRRSIVHAPLADQIRYATGDADWTGRLATWLEGERKRIVQEEWCVT